MKKQQPAAEPTPDLSRLPASYRQHIARLEGRIVELEAARPPAGKTGIIVDPYAAEPSYVKDGSTVRFTVTARHQNWDRHVDVSVERGGRRLSIRAADGRIVVHPEVSNVIGIEVEV